MQRLKLGPIGLHPIDRPSAERRHTVGDTIQPTSILRHFCRRAAQHVVRKRFHDCETGVIGGDRPQNPRTIILPNQRQGRRVINLVPHHHRWRVRIQRTRPHRTRTINPIIQPIGINPKNPTLIQRRRHSQRSKQGLTLQR